MEVVSPDNNKDKDGENDNVPVNKEILCPVSQESGLGSAEDSNQKARWSRIQGE
jgi:hypothetical protein